jgi:hypothetical protein
MQNTAEAFSGQPRIGSRPVMRPRLEKPASTALDYFLDFLCFLIPAANFYTIKFIGVLPLGEVIVLVMFIPCLLTSWKRIWRGYNKTIFMMMGFWLLSQIVSDFYNHSPFENMAKGEALIAFFAMDVVVLSALAYKNYKRILYFGIGYVVEATLGFYFAPVNYDSFGDSDASWKFGYAPILIGITILISCYFYGKRKYLIPAILILGIAAINLSQNYRSQVLILASVAILVIPVSTWARRRSGPAPAIKSDENAPISLKSAFTRESLIVVSLLVFVAFGVSKSYSYLASAGALGEEAQDKYIAQSRGKLGLLIGGRPETMVSVYAVMDSPIVGHGSWAEDSKYIEMLQDLSSETGYTEEGGQGQSLDASFLIPTHSYLMGAWVFAGFVGALFWIYVYYLVILGIFKLMVYHPPLSPYFAYWLISSLWNILFSPFGQGVRMEMAVLLVIIGSLLEPTEYGAPLQSVRTFKESFIVGGIRHNFVGIGR